MGMATITECAARRFSQIQSLSVTCVMTITLFSSPHDSTAAEWEFSPVLELKAGYSDNIRLAPRGKENGDYIAQFNPGIDFSGTGTHMKVFGYYHMQNIFYAEDQSKNSTHHILNSGANAELLDEYLFLDATASITQQSISPVAPVTLDNTNIVDDRTDIRTYSVSPYFHHNFGNLFLSELRYTHNVVESSANGLFDSQAEKFLFQLKNGPHFRIMGWELNYAKQNIDYISANTDVENERYFLKLSYLLSSKFSLDATGGYERYDYLSLNQNPEGSYWLAGFRWTPSERTDIEASAGKRFYGDTYSLLAKHRSRRAVWSLGYNEEITDTRSQLFIPASIDTASFLNQLWLSSIPDPVIRQQMIAAFMLENSIPSSLANPLNLITNRIFLQKSLQASLALGGRRNTVIFSLFNVDREAQTSGIADSALLGVSNISLTDKSKQTGANLIWNLKISPISNANFGLGYIQNSFPDLDQKFDTKSLSLNLIRRLLPDINGSLGVRHIRRESSAGIGDYRENSITASIQMRF
jgi:uncharacterized protein (PEP-CTERM system associated)